MRDQRFLSGNLDRIKYYVALGAAAIFLILFIIFVILYATKGSKADPTNVFFVTWKSSNGATDSSLQDSIQQIFDDMHMKAKCFTTVSNEGDIKKLLTTAVLTDSKGGDISAEYLTSMLKTYLNLDTHKSFSLRLEAINSPLQLTGTASLEQMMSKCVIADTASDPSSTQCVISNVQRDIIIFVDVIEETESAGKFEAIRKLLQSIGGQLTFSDSISRVALIGYGTNQYLNLQPFASSSDDYQKQIDNLLDNPSPKTFSNFANLAYAMEKFLSMTNNESAVGYNFRSAKDIVVLIVADHIPADKDSSLDKIGQEIKLLQRHGFLVGAITYTKTGAAKEFDELNNQNQKFTNYNDLPEVGKKFAVQHICAYFIPDVPVTDSTTTSPITVSYQPTNKLHNANLMIIVERTEAIKALYEFELKNFFLDLFNNYIQFSNTDQKYDPAQYTATGLIQFSDHSSVDIRLQKLNLAHLLALFNNQYKYEKPDGVTDLTEALRKANDAFLEQSTSSTHAFSNVILIVASGSPTIHDNYCYYANHLLSNGIKIVTVGLKGNGEFNDQEVMRLHCLSGNETDLIFIGNKEVLNTSKIAGAIDSAIKSNSVITEMQRNTTAATIKLCNPIVFAVETTEVLYDYMDYMINATAQIAEYYDNSDQIHCHLTFSLITYSTAAYAHIRIEDQLNYQDYAFRVQKLLNTNRAEINSYYDAKPNINSAIYLIVQALQNYDKNTRVGPLTVIFIGQAEKTKVPIQLPATTTLKTLADYIYVSNIAENMKSIEWQAITLSSRIINEKRISVSGAEQLAKNMTKQIDSDLQKINWESRKFESCSAEKAVDLVLVIHQVKSAEEQEKINKFASEFVSAFDVKYGLFRIGVIQSQASEWVKRIGISEENNRIKVYIDSIPAGNNYMSAAEPLRKIKEEYESIYSEAARRRFATFSVIYIAKEGTLDELSKVRPLLDEWKKFDCTGVPKLSLINIGHFSQQNEPEVQELFEKAIYLIEENNFYVRNNTFYEATNKIIDSLCTQIQTEPTDCLECCNCKTGVRLRGECVNIEEKRTSFLRLFMYD